MEQKITLENYTSAILAIKNVFDKKIESKLGIAFKTHNFPDYNKVVKKHFSDPLNKKKLELAILDNDGGVIIDAQGNYKHSREDLQKTFDFQRELDQKEVDIDPFKTKFKYLSKSEKDMIYNEKENIYKADISKEIYGHLSLFIDDMPPYKVFNDSETE